MRAALWVALVLLVARAAFRARADSTPYPGYPTPPNPTEEPSSAYPEASTATAVSNQTPQETDAPTPTVPAATQEASPSPTQPLTPTATPTQVGSPEVGATKGLSPSASDTAKPTMLPQAPPQGGGISTPYPEAATPNEAPNASSPPASSPVAQPTQPAALVLETPDRAAALISTAVAMNKAAPSSSAPRSQRAFCRGYVVLAAAVGSLLAIAVRARSASSRHDRGHQ